MTSSQIIDAWKASCCRWIIFMCKFERHAQVATTIVITIFSWVKKKLKGHNYFSNNIKSKKNDFFWGIQFYSVRGIESQIIKKNARLIQSVVSPYHTWLLCNSYIMVHSMRNVLKLHKYIRQSLSSGITHITTHIPTFCQSYGFIFYL